MPDNGFNAAAGLGWSDGVLLLLLLLSFLSLEKNSGAVSMSLALDNTSTPGAITLGDVLERCCIISSLVGTALELS